MITILYDPVCNEIVLKEPSLWAGLAYNRYSYSNENAYGATKNREEWREVLDRLIYVGEL